MRCKPFHNVFFKTVKTALTGPAVIILLLTGFPLFAEDYKSENSALEGLKISGTLRFRPTYRGNYDHDSKTDDHREYVGQRIWLTVEKELPWNSKGVITIQDSRIWGSEPGSDSGLSTANDFTDEALDLREAYFQIEKIGGFLDARVGRQKIHFGDWRIMGPADWNHGGRSFDAIRFDINTKYYLGTLFGAVIGEDDNDAQGITTSTGPQNSSGFDFICDANLLCQVQASVQKELDDAYLSGFHNTFKVHPQFWADVYYIGIHKNYIPATSPFITGTELTSDSRQKQRDNLHTFGIRVTNRTQDGKIPGGLIDYTFEYAAQTGRNGERVQAPWDIYNVQIPVTDIYGVPVIEDGAQRTEPLYTEKVRYDTWAAAAKLGIHVTDWLRIGGEVDVASGDPNRTDSTIGRFQSRFAANVSVYGLADGAGWSNMIARSGNITFDFKKYGSLHLAYWHVNKHKSQDGHYINAGGRFTQSDGTRGTTESEANARFGNITNATGEVTSVAVAYLGQHLYREYHIRYKVKYHSLAFDMAYGWIRGGNAFQNEVDDIYLPFAQRTPSFDPKAAFAFVAMTYSF